MTARKWRSPAMLFAVLLVLALASLGVGYGLWSKTLYINGTVGTGDVDAEWTSVGCFDNEPGLPEPKDIGITRGWIDPDDAQILHFEIENGYPSYIGDCQVHFGNTGTIPLMVEAITFLPGAELTNCSVVQDPNTGSFVASCDQLTVGWFDGLCLQLDPGAIPIASSLEVHVEQKADQDSDYAFDVEVLLVQWNESTCPLAP